MADDFLIMQPNGQFARIKATDTGGGVLVPQVGGLGALLHAGYMAGGFQTMFDGISAGGTAIAAVDTLYIYPHPIDAPLTITSLFARVAGVGVGSSLKTAVWAGDPVTGRPTGLPVLGQNAGYDTAGSTGIKSAAIASVAVTPKMYWWGSVGTGTLPIMFSVSATSWIQSSKMAQASQASAMTTVGPVGLSTPFAYAGDIMALNLTGAVWTPVVAAGIPLLGVGWA